MLKAIRKLFSRPEPGARSGAAPQGGFDFRCNICGHLNSGVPLAQVSNREFQSCRECLSSLRMRSTINVLSEGLFRRSLPIADFPADKSIRGLGMSDWEGYACRLAGKFDYTNTFYDRSPRLDITDVPTHAHGRYDFVLSSDVFEHIPLMGLEAAFRNARRLLVPDGIFVLTVPWFDIPETVEHFPNLHRFEVVDRDGGRILLNTTLEGKEETYSDLVFHGGEGMTLEMRSFSRQGVLDHLAKAGFSSISVINRDVGEFGIVWEIQWAYPILARA